MLNLSLKRWSRYECRVVLVHDRALSNTLSEQLDYEKETQRMLFDFPHVSEGIRAFIEKREPNFRDVS